MTGEVSVTGLTHRFGGLPVLEGLDLTVGPGEAVAVVGPSGCGKSTLLRVLAGLVTPTDGHVAIDGADVAGRTGHAAYMPQSDALLPWRRALDNATLGAEVAGGNRRNTRRRAEELFSRFGLSGFERAWPAELSGGMRQRVAFLRTILTGHGVLLLDEPFGALDAITRADLHGWFGELLSEEPRTLLLVTHDIDDALRLTDRILILSHRPGRVVATVEVPGGRPRDGLRLLDADVAAVKRRVLTALGGESVNRPGSVATPDNGRLAD